MYKCERENEILSILNNCNYVTVDYLVDQLHISASSIRRDLKYLEERGVVKRSYGGAELVNSTNKAVPFSMRSHENVAQKKKIAQKAVSLFGDGDVIFIDGSSSSFFLAEFLTAVKNITVITNSIDSLYYLSQYDIKVYCTGGLISATNRAVLVDHFAENLIRNVHADYTVFSVQSVTAEGELFDCYESEVPLRKLMIGHSEKSVLLCDSSKFHQKSTFYQGHVREIDYIVSDIDLGGYFDEEYEKPRFIRA